MTEYYGISYEALLGVFPESLRADENVTRLASVVAKALDEEIENVELVNIFTRIDDLPESLMDRIASDFNITWYTNDAGIDRKRQVLKQSMYYIKHLGTKAAVSYIVGASFESAAVEEWFEYSGSPFNYRIVVDGGEYPPDMEVVGGIKSRIRYIANVRSVLERVIGKIRKTINIYVGTAGKEHSKSTSSIDEIYSCDVLADENSAWVMSEQKTILV